MNEKLLNFKDYQDEITRSGKISLCDAEELCKKVNHVGWGINKINAAFPHEIYGSFEDFIYENENRCFEYGNRDFHITAYSSVQEYWIKSYRNYLENSSAELGDKLERVIEYLNDTLEKAIPEDIKTLEAILYINPNESSFLTDNIDFLYESFVGVSFAESAQTPYLISAVEEVSPPIHMPELLTFDQFKHIVDECFAENNEGLNYQIEYQRSLEEFFDQSPVTMTRFIEMVNYMNLALTTHIPKNLNNFESNQLTDDQIIFFKENVDFFEQTFKGIHFDTFGVEPKQPPLLSAEDHFSTQQTNVEPSSIEM